MKKKRQLVANLTVPMRHNSILLVITEDVLSTEKPPKNLVAFTHQVSEEIFKPFQVLPCSKLTGFILYSCNHLSFAISNR